MSETVCSYRMTVELDDWRCVEVIERLDLTPSVILSFLGLVLLVLVVVVAVLVLFELDPHDARNEQWTQKTHQYLTLSQDGNSALTGCAEYTLSRPLKQCISFGL